MGAGVPGAVANLDLVAGSCGGLDTLTSAGVRLFRLAGSWTTALEHLPL